jgi:hypothetical protein
MDDHASSDEGFDFKGEFVVSVAAGDAGSGGRRMRFWG